jgi:hypothetical protein
LSGVENVADRNFSNIRLLRDTDDDAVYDSADVVVSTGVMSLSGTEGTITFEDDFLSNTTKTTSLWPTGTHQ